MDSPLDLIRGLEREEGVELSEEERLLLGTDGSVTFLLEVLTGHEVAVETLGQEVVPASGEQAEALGIREGSEVNGRRVVLTGGGGDLIYAESWTPLEQLEPEFEEELMREEKPIGRIMAEQGIEARRDLREMGVTEEGEGVEVLGEGSLFFREYDIVREGDVLMRIREEFSSGLFG